MINLPELFERLQESGLVQKSFLDCTKSEIETVCNAVLSSFDSTVPPNGWTMPYIENDRLVIPSDSHPKYHWWMGEGQGLLATLIELDAPYSLVKKHFPQITETAYLNQLIPF